jgi:UDP-3-O-[3-hydroxymyristoyl] glucosamine N-acyltransferase
MTSLSFTVQEIAELLQCEAVGSLDHCIHGVDYLELATKEHATFLDNPLYQKFLTTTEAGLIVIHPKMARVEGKTYLLSTSPSLTFQKIIELFIQPIPSAFCGIHPSAYIDKSVLLGENVTIGPHVVIDRGCTIGDNSTIGAGVFIGAESILGTSCLIHPHVVIREGSFLGNRVIIQPGVVIGSCGYGYHTDKQGKHTFLKQLGRVVLEDDVEIGANTTIDRARFKETRIKRGTKIDNLVQIGHQVELGEDNLIVSQVGISGSTKTGRNVVIGGQSGIAGHVTIGDQVTLAARSGVSKSIDEPGIYMGAPVMPRKEFGTHFAQLRSIGKLIERVASLEEHSTPS